MKSADETVCIIGLGYVGLPLACLCAGRGLDVRGLEVSSSIVDKVNRGTSHIDDAKLKREVAVLKGKIRATSDAAEAMKGADAVIVCVPTPVDAQQEPDLAALKSACSAIAKNLKKGQMVIIESTIYPGTVEEVVLPILEQGSGLKAGKDFDLAHCPERIDPGNEKWPVEKIPRVVAALTPEGTRRAATFYRGILDKGVPVLELKSLKAAEAVKVTENTFRDINIAFVNELAKSFDQLGIDISEVVSGASTKPFGFMPFYPGPGVGGHCIPVDPYYLIKRARDSGFEHRFLSLAREINNSMPDYVASLAEKMARNLGAGMKGMRICVLGISYKKGIDDARNSPAMEIAELLAKKGADVVSFDPHIPSKSAAKSLEEALKGSAIAVLATDHKEFISPLPPASLKKLGVKGVIDARNALDREGIIAAGILYKGIGR
ncbi:MAG: nucleotide sugar dehydrogenase [Candidatus Diapherotrites archaeon]